MVFFQFSFDCSEKKIKQNLELGPLNQTIKGIC